VAEHHDKRAKNMEAWRKNILKHHLIEALIILELVLSVIFLVISYITGKIYFKGVGIGLVIAWVTSAIAYLFKKKMAKP
jgi:hypothetical protein